MLAFACGVRTGPRVRPGIHGDQPVRHEVLELPGRRPPGRRHRPEHGHETSQGGIEATPPPGTCDCQDVEGIDIHFPTGFIGSPTSIPQCSLADFSTGKCPVNAQVGEVDLGLHRSQARSTTCRPGPEEAALTAFEVPIHELGCVHRPARANRARTTGSMPRRRESSTSCRVSDLHIHLWGVPALPVHDVNRWPQQTGTLLAERISESVLRADRIQQPAGPIPRGADHLRHAADGRRRRSLLRLHERPGRNLRSRRPSAATS